MDILDGKGYECIGSFWFNRTFEQDARACVGRSTEPPVYSLVRGTYVVSPSSAARLRVLCEATGKQRALGELSGEWNTSSQRCPCDGATCWLREAMAKWGSISEGKLQRGWRKMYTCWMQWENDCFLCALLPTGQMLCLRGHPLSGESDPRGCTCGSLRSPNSPGFLVVD